MASMTIESVRLIWEEKLLQPAKITCLNKTSLPLFMHSRPVFALVNVPLYPRAYICSHGPERGEKQSCLGHPWMTETFQLSCQKHRRDQMFFQAFYCSQSRRRSAMRGENACLPRNQRASLIAIPTVMAKDEADQYPSTPIPKAITFNRKTHLLLLTFALFCFTIRTASSDEEGIRLNGQLWLWIFFSTFITFFYCSVDNNKCRNRQKVKTVNR